MTSSHDRSSDNPDHERFQLVVESAPNGIVVADQIGNVVMVNRTAEELFGYSRAEFLRLKVEDLIPRRVRDQHRKNRETFQRSPETRNMGAGRDLYAMRKNGEEFPVEIGLTPLPEKDGMLILSSIVDITERKLASEERLRYSKQLERRNEELRLQSEILQNVHDAVFLVNQDGVVVDWNNGAARIFGVKSEEAIGYPITEVCPTVGAHPFFDRILPALEGRPSTDQLIRCEIESGKEIFLRTHASKMALTDGDGYLVCASDVTEQKRLEDEILSVSENEQRRIGQDIHDDLCSQLSGIGCLSKAMEATLSKHHKQEAEMMAQITEMLAGAGKTARQIAKGLVPAAVETHGLSGAIREIGERSREVFGVNCATRVTNVKTIDDLPLGTAVQLYRIAQEATSNAIKHSDAESIKVSIGIEGNLLRLIVEDDGKGMPKDLVSAGMGLLTMRRRAEIIQADFDIHASPGAGTKIQCSIEI